MADLEDDTLDLTEELEADEADEQEDQSEVEAGEEDAGDDEDETVEFEGEESPTSGVAETGLVKHLRTQLKEQRREIETLRKVTPQAAPIEVGEKPTLSGCDYDEEAFETALDQWKTRKAQAETQVAEQQKAQQSQAEAWNQELQGHHAKKAALKFKDVQEAEDVALASLSEIQQAVIVKAAENSAMVVYALGKYPARLAEISKITDPIKLTAAIVRMESKMKVTKRGGPPEPERIARGGAPVSQSKDKKEEQLEKDADRTGDRTALIAYRKQKAQAK